MTIESDEGGGRTRQEDYDDTVRSPATNLLVIAPPGCGKTELLARRANHLIETLEPHQRILALTFSNRAKANLSSRLRDVLGVARMRRHVTVRNFHGHAAEVIRAHGNTVGIDPAFEMPTRRTQPDAMADYLEGLTAKESGALKDLIETDLRTPKQRPYTDEQVLVWMDANADNRSIEIEIARQESGVPHYDDLLRQAQRILRVPEVANLYREHYAVVLVDEFQDLSPQQLDIAMRTCDRGRTFVGDPLQGIYSWAGARPVQIEKQLRRVCGDPAGLGVSYRSSPRVLDLLNAVAAELGGHPLEPDDAEAWYDGGITAGFVAPTGEREAELIVETCQAIMSIQPSATIGVISRMGWRRALVDSAFSAADVPHIRWDLAIDDPVISELMRHAAERLGPKDIDADTLGAEMLAGVDAADVHTRSDIDDAIAQVTEWAAGAGSLRAALDRLVDPDTDAPIAPGVHLLNAHVGKGQQFDWVFVPGFEKGHLPSFLAGNRAAELLEEKRILLVMLSRARHGVVVSRAQTLVSKAGNTYNTDRSPWTTLVAGFVVAVNSDGLQGHLSGLAVAADS